MLGPYRESLKMRPPCYPVIDPHISMENAIDAAKGLIGKSYKKWKENDIVYYISKMKGNKNYNFFVVNFNKN